MRKLLILLIFLPILAIAQWTEPGLQKDNGWWGHNTFYGKATFADTAFFQEATFTYIEVDTVVITYVTGSTAMDSLAVNVIIVNTKIKPDANNGAVLGEANTRFSAGFFNYIFANNIGDTDGSDTTGFTVTNGVWAASGIDTLRGLTVLVSQKAKIDTLYWDSDFNTYTVGGDDLQRLFTGGVQAWVIGNNGFQINRDVTMDSVVIISGETFLGDTLTDTTTVYRVQHKGSVMFDILEAGTKYLDFSLANNASATTYWLYANSSNYWSTSGTLNASVIRGNSEVTVGDDKYITLGTYSEAAFMWETADANANELIIYLPEGGATDVPVGVFGDASILNVNLGWFNGVTEPRWVVVDDDADSWVGISHSADDTPAIMIGGAAKSFTLPNALTLQLHTIATGDSVVFNFILDATDSTLKYYDNAGWVEYYRQGGTDVADADIASSATWNARLDTATIVTWADTNVVATQYFVDDMVGDSIANSLGDLSAQIGAVLKDSLNLDTKAEFNALTSDQDFLFKDDSTLYATLTALGTMVGDSVKNTLADLNIQLSVTLKDSSLLDTPTEFKALFVTGEEPLFKSDSADGDGFATPTDLTAYLPLAGGIMSGDIWYGDPGTSANSKTLYFLSDNGTEVDTAAIQAMYGDDPYLRIFAPSDAGSPTAIMDLKDTRIVIGAGTAGIDYEIYLNGETSQGTITYYEDEDMFGFDNGIQANHIQLSDGTSLPTGIATYCPVAVKSDSLMISFDNGTTWMHIVTQARAVP